MECFCPANCWSFTALLLLLVGGGGGWWTWRLVVGDEFALGSTQASVTACVHLSVTLTPHSTSSTITLRYDYVISTAGSLASLVFFSPTVSAEGLLSEILCVDGVISPFWRIRQIYKCTGDVHCIHILFLSVSLLSSSTLLTVDSHLLEGDL